MIQRPEPACVEALIAQAAVEAFQSYDQANIRREVKVGLVHIQPCRSMQNGHVAWLRVAVRRRLIPVTRPLHAQQPAGRAFAQMELAGDERNVAS
jgi:hypothetical protein